MNVALVHEAITMEFNVLEREAKLEEIRKDKEAKEKMTSSKRNLEMLTNIVNKAMHMISKRKEEDYNVEVGTDYSKHPVLFSWEEQAQSLQCKDNNQNFHVEQDCKEENAGSCQEILSSLPTSCASLLREHCKQVANRNKEECSRGLVRE